MSRNVSTQPPGGQAPDLATFATRREAVRGALRESGAQAVAVGPGDDMAYLLGGHSVADERPCLLLVSARGDALLVPRLAEEELRPLCHDVRVRAWDDGDDVLAALRALLGEMEVPEGAQLIIDPTLRADVLLMLQAAVPKGRTLLDPPLVTQARLVKDDQELNRLKAAADLADAAVAFAWNSAVEGISEIELSSLVRSFHERNGGTQPFAGVSFGANSSLPHHTPGSDRLEPGMLILLDTGSRLHGYQSDITRMAWFGPTEPPREVSRLVEHVEAAVEAAYAAARPGVTGGAVDAAARHALTAARLGDRFVHRTGHGIGLSVHEAPYLAPGSRDELVPGSAFTIEPGAYLPGRYGVRLEDTVIMTAQGPVALTRSPRALAVLPVGEA